MDRTTAPPPMLLYTSRGDFSAYLLYPFLYNSQGEWIGWVTPSKEVFNVEGVFVGTISNDHRILRKRNAETINARRIPPSNPPMKARLPGSVPLPPRMAEFSYDIVDILEEMPELLHTPDAGILRPDAD
jgi:hypothetical protein